MRTDILGVGFDNITMDEAVTRSMEMMTLGEKGYVVTPNPEIVWMCRDDDKLKAAIHDASLVLADGVGIYYGAKILKRPLKTRLPGIDFAGQLFGAMAEKSMSLYLLGAKPGVAELAAKNLESKYPGLRIVGIGDGYFKEDEPVIAKINDAVPDLLLVCLGAPKQEYWMRDNMDKLNVKLMAGLGGSLDVFAGTVERAPEAWQKLGLEWLHRLIKQPSRIGRMMKLPMFLFAVIGQRLRGK